MKRTVLLAILSLTFVFSAFAEGKSERIINGTNADPSRYPWMAVISYSDLTFQEVRFCGAVLVHPQYVVTAAHCVIGFAGFSDAIKVNFGVNTVLEGPEDSVVAEQIITHPDYGTVGLSGYPTNDIALVRLKRPVDYPVISIFEAYTDTLSATVKVLGFGQEHQELVLYPNILQEVDIPLWTQDACEAVWTPRAFDREAMICAGDIANEKDSCYGDSGGPLIINEGGTFKTLGNCKLRPGLCR